MKRADHGYGLAFCRWACALALAVFSLTAHAKGEAGRWSDLEWYNQTAGGASGRTVPSGGSGPYSFSPGQGGAFQKGQKALPWPGKNQAKAMAGWKSLAKSGSMAKSIVNPVGGAINLLGALAIKQLIDEACVRVFGGELRPGAAWDECIFSETQITQYSTWTQTSHQTLATSQRFGWQNTAQEACNLFVGTIAEGNQWPAGQVSPSSGQSSYTATTNPEGQPSKARYRRTWTATASKTGTTWWCRAEHDRTDLVTGEVTHWVDESGIGFATQQGQATTQTGWKPITETEAADKLEDKLDEWCQADFLYGRDGSASNCANTLEELTLNGQSVEVEDPVLSGPVHVEGNCTTTKTITDQATGSYTLKTTCTDADYDYTGNTVKRTEVKKETTTPYNADGTEAGPSEEKEEESTDERTRCERDPSAFGCESLEVPTQEIPRDTAVVTYQAEDLGLGGGACPAPFAWHDSLGSHAIDLSPYCDKVVTIIKPLILAFAALTCLFILMPGRAEG